MRVAGADEAHAEWVSTALVLQGKALDQGLPDVAAVGQAVLADVALARIEDFKFRPLVQGREPRVGFGGALDFGDLHQRLVAHPGFGEGGIRRPSIGVAHPEHLAIGLVGVVGNGQGLHAPRPRRVHPRPERFRIA